jgi:ribosomal protein S18 acetylase RimI-like enzyme
MIIKDAKHPDLDKIAECHIAAFPTSITSLFGVGFVSQMLQWYLSGPNKFLFWIEEDQKCIGYCGGFVMDGSDAYGSASGMSQFGFGAAAKIMIRKPWLFFHPEIRARYPFIFINIKRRLKKIIGIGEKPKPVISTTQKEVEPTAGLVVIGVHPNMHKKGIGSLLQQEFERKSIQLGAKQMQLSVRVENAQAISSYKRNGWSIIEDQKISYLMTKTI